MAVCMETTNLGGRPKLKTFDEIIQIGKDFVKWATNNPNALTVPQYATSINLNSAIFREWARQNDEFSALYKEAKEHIGINRLKSSHQATKGDFNLDLSVYRGTIWHYDYDVREDIKEEKAFEADLKAEKDQKTTPIQINLVDYARKET
jgi:hypothetical protein